MAAPRVMLGEYAPDLVDNLSPSIKTANNCFPRQDGYGPVQDLVAFTASLPGPCKGYGFARNPDGSVSLFAGTSTKLYQLNNTTFTWSDVSVGGSSYSGVPNSDNWQFQQFNNLYFATQINTPLQVFNLSSPSTFTNALGSPPQARYVTVVNRFLVLSGISGEPYRVQWSGLNNVNASTSWDNLTAQSNYQDIPDGGLVRGVAGGEYGLITQDGALRRMIYAAGSPIIFQIERISEEKGIFAPYSLTRSGDRVFWIGIDGFKMLVPGGYPQPIGKNKVDASFFADVDANNLQFCLGASDPTQTRVYFSYKSTSGSAGQFDKILCYDWALEKFTPITLSGQYIATLAKPGLTLEGLDPIAPGALVISGVANNGSGAIRITVPSTSSLSTGQIKTITQVLGTGGLGDGLVGGAANGSFTITVVDSTHFDLQGSAFVGSYTSGGVVGGSLDALPFSLDSVSSAAFAQLSICNGSNAVGFLTGPNLEATVDTTEEASDGERLWVRGFAPITDSPVVYGSVSYRSNLQAVANYTSESQMNALGYCPLRLDTRYCRARSRIPYGTSWTYIEAVIPDFGRAGKR